MNYLSKLSRKRGGSWAWAVALSLFAASLGVRLFFASSLTGLTFLMFYPAVTLSALICGWQQGLAILCLSTLAAWYFFLGPTFSLAQKDTQVSAAFIAFAFVGGFLVVLLAVLRETVRRLDIAKAAQETLFSELQHRVANNLQLVVSLLRHARRHLRNPVVAAETLSEAEERILAMSQLHRRLHDGTAFVYGLHPLLREMLLNTFRDLPVRVRVDIGDVPDLSIDQMTAIALLVNEAAINAAKHVFSKGLGTEFIVSLSSDESAGVQLSIGDDGPGIEVEAGEGPEASLGMGLMEAFAAQLGGSLEVVNDAGMSLSVKFATP